MNKNHKWLIFVFIIFLAFTASPSLRVSHSQTTVTLPALPEDTTPTSDDIVLTFDLTGTVPRERKVTLANIPKAWGTTAAELAFTSGVTSAIQTQLGAKAPLASPTFTGTVTFPSPFTLGATSVTTTGVELNFVAGVSSAIQIQLNGKAATSHNHSADNITSGTLSLTRGGTGAALSDPGANRLSGWDDTDNAFKWIILGAGLSYDAPTDTLSVTGTGYATLQEEGANLTQRLILNFVGAGMTAADDTGNSRTNLTLDADLNAIAALACSDNQIMKKSGGVWICAADETGAGGGYTTIQEEGGNLTQRSTLNFIGAGITAADDAGNTRTDVTLHADLNAIAGLGTTGILARTGSGTYSTRTITGDTEIVVSNGDGVSGNPTLSIGADIARDSEIATHAAVSSSVHGVTGTVVGSSDTQTLTNKTLTDSTTSFQDETDNSKKFRFQASGITAGQTRVVTMRDMDGTMEYTGHGHVAANISDFNEAAQDTVGGILIDTTTLDFTYNDAGGQITADVIADTSVQKLDIRKNTGANIGSRRRLNLIEGSNVTLTVSDDGTDNEIDVTIAAPGVSGYNVIQEEGTPVTQRTTLNFVGSGFTAADDEGNTRTNLTLDGDLNAVAALATTGIPKRTAADTWSMAVAGTDYSAPGHAHAASDTTSGTFDNARVNWASPGAIGGTAPAAGAFTTLGAGGGGFAVDADGDVTAKSVTVTKQSGMAGDLGLYEANGTDTDAAGFRGPASMSANTSYRGQFPNSRTTTANMILLWTNSGETGTGTPTDPYIQSTSWAIHGQISNIGTFASPVATNPYTLAAANTYNSTLWYGATGEIDLPAAVAGMSILIYNTGAFTITIDPNGTDVIVRDGTAQSAGVSFTLSSGAGNYVTLISDAANHWVTLGFKGTLSEGT